MPSIHFGNFIQCHITKHLLTLFKRNALLEVMFQLAEDTEGKEMQAVNSVD